MLYDLLARQTRSSRTGSATRRAAGWRGTRDRQQLTPALGPVRAQWRHRELTTPVAKRSRHPAWDITGKEGSCSWNLDGQRYGERDYVRSSRRRFARPKPGSTRRDRRPWRGEHGSRNARAPVHRRRLLGRFPERPVPLAARRPDLPRQAASWRRWGKRRRYRRAASRRSRQRSCAAT